MVNSERTISDTSRIDAKGRKMTVPEGLVMFVVLVANLALVAAVVRRGRARAATPQPAYLRIVGAASPPSRRHEARRRSRD